MLRDTIHDDATTDAGADAKRAKPAHAAPSTASSSPLPKRPGLDF
jgi:hypothetical protein